MSHWQYLLVLAACLVITLPLELLGPGVYRQPWRTAVAVMPVAVVFVVIPLCGLLTYNAVEAILKRLRRFRSEAARMP
jgi:hypothetical protein